MESGSQNPWRCLREGYSLDIRALAAFRVGLALVALWDLWFRFQSVAAFSSDAGMYPRDVAASYLSPWTFSLDAMSGLASFQILLMGITAVALLCFMVGYRTRLAGFMIWILTVSLHNQAPPVTYGGEQTIRVMLFWAMFLPLNAAWSVDRALDTNEETPPPPQIFSAATLGLMVQFAAIYLFTALAYALQPDYHVLPLVRSLSQFPVLLPGLTYLTLTLAFLIPVLAFSPFRPQASRTLAFLLLAGLQIVIGTTMNAGLFPWIGLVSGVAILPSNFWDWLARRTVYTEALIIYYDGDCGFCKKLACLLKTFLILPSAQILPAQSDPKIENLMQARNSWVLQGAKGDLYTEYEALVQVFQKAALPIRCFSGLLRQIPKTGLTAYRWVANHRLQLGLLLRPLEFRPLRWESTLLGSFLCSMALIFVLIWNVIILSPGWDGLNSRPEALDAIGNLTGLRQYWSFLAPSPDH